MLNKNGEKSEKSLVDRLNIKIEEDIQSIIRKGGSIKKLGDILKNYGIKEIKLGWIKFNDYILDDGRKYIDPRVLDAIFELDIHYKNVDISKKFYSEFNKNNPYRIEITFGKEKGSDKALIYAFGHKIIFPYAKEYLDLDDRGKSLYLPKLIMVVLRPEDFNENRKIIEQLNDYEIMHIRFSNDYYSPDYGSLTISKYMPNHFSYKGNRKNILNKWNFLIPGLKESFYTK